ncbi:hypothetical protein E4191_07765 [Paracoccus liaowanqingii]|uniref:Uncharacterized protein n=1 Tax=Paracoccus liaowanqingii TaxID=2560053 RepID=A0A4P7HN67_9RHOB|nr:hypothetical protein [Paracoccus liaowanqingii]QBX34621.1 hypothetical protein E4191_07765 [Paracoccus liaowanqingii]
MSPRPQPIKHGTIYAYKCRGCRCDPCTRANTETCKTERRRKGILSPGNACKVGTEVFTTQQEAARAAGRTKGAITYHLNRYGNLDRLGGKRGGPSKGRCKPVCVGMQEWPSRSALDRALGVPIGTVSAWILRGDMNALIGAVMNMNPARKAAA